MTPTEYTVVLLFEIQFLGWKVKIELVSWICGENIRHFAWISKYCEWNAEGSWAGDLLDVGSSKQTKQMFDGLLRILSKFLDLFKNRKETEEKSFYSFLFISFWDFWFFFLLLFFKFSYWIFLDKVLVEKCIFPSHVGTFLKALRMSYMKTFQLLILLLNFPNDFP